MQEFSEKLYKLDSKQKERILHVFTLGVTLNQESGLVDGAKVLHAKICTGKNIGKSNETTGEQQAQLQAASKVAEKLTEGYFRTIEEAKNIKVVMPMLAHSYSDYKDKIDWNKPVYVQRKFDGMRCLCIVEKGSVRLMSRAGKDITTVPHIVDEIKSMITSTSSFIIDGELYSEELSTFQENMRAIKKYRPGITEKVSYHLYDIVSDKTFEERYKMLNLLENHWKDKS